MGQAGKDQVRPDVGQRLQHEAAQVQAWMRKDENRIIAHEVVRVEQIEIERAR